MDDILSTLDAVSQRECALPGMATGALLCERCHARAVSAAFREEVAKGAGKNECRLGAPLHISEQWLLFPLSTAAAARLPSVLAAADSELARLVRRAGRFFPGVRRCGTFEQPAADMRPRDAPPPAGCRFTFAELFAGIGGFRLGLEPLGGRCVYASEVDGAARETYSANFGSGEAVLVGDILDE